MRTAHGIYRTLQQYVDEADKDGFDEDIDMDFRSVRPPSRPSSQLLTRQGVLLGTGTSSLMLSLLPGKVLKASATSSFKCMISLILRSQKYSDTLETVKSHLKP
jgi:hypothetical protein